MNKSFLFLLGLLCTLIVITARADTIMNGFTFTEQTDAIEVLPEELPKTGAEEWNGNCSSYGDNSYWKEGTCYTSKGARVFSKTITNTTDTKHVCTLDNNQLYKLMNRLKELELEYAKMDVMCIDIVKVENEIKDLVNQLFISRNKTTTNSKTVETAKWIPFPDPQIKRLTKTISVKACTVGYTYQKSLDACLPDISPRTGAR